MIKVLVVEDSPITRKMLMHILRKDPAISLVSEAEDGLQAIEMVKKMNYDVITMDLNMPKMNGIDATRDIMSTHPVPIIILTAGTSNEDEGVNTFKALEAGAVSVILKPSSEEQTKTFLDMVKTMSVVKVIRRTRKKEMATTPPLPELHCIKLVAIGASTGGPQVLQHIFKRLSDIEFPPIVVVQHISNGFIDYMTRWLQQTTDVPVKVAINNEKLQANQIYFAPEGYNMGINMNFTIQLSKASLNKNEAKPSISYLFHSINLLTDKHIMGILLTGMGTDGATELKVLKDRGGITVCQDEISSVVYGIPGAAIALNGATYTLTPDEIAILIKRIKNHDKVI